MEDWRELVARGEYAKAEPLMRAETDRGAGFFPDNEVRGEFYEGWGDSLTDRTAAKRKYDEALMNWQMFASCSTSGGEGTARMTDVNRVVAKLEALNAD
jgi:hypothetical protein